MAMFKKKSEVTQEQVTELSEQVLAAMDQAMENFDNGKVSEPINEQLPTDEELAEQQERLEMDRKKHMKWQTALVLYPSILAGVCANPNVPDNICAKVSIGILEKALEELQQFGDKL